MGMLAGIHEYISEKASPKSAQKYVSGIYDSVKKLETHPKSCAPCIHHKLQKAGYRCCKHKNHIIIYEFGGEIEVEILAIIHSRRSPMFFEKMVE